MGEDKDVCRQELLHCFGYWKAAVAFLGGPKASLTGILDVYISSGVWWELGFLGYMRSGWGSWCRKAQERLFHSLQLLDRRAKPGGGRALPSGNKWQDEREQNQTAGKERKDLGWILGKISSPKRLSSPGTAALVSVESSFLEGLKSCVGTGWLWHCWGNGWTRWSQRALPT